MGNYNLSVRAQLDLIEIYKYGIPIYGIVQAQKYLNGLDELIQELSTRPELAKDASNIYKGLKSYKYKAHTIFFVIEPINFIFIVRILGKRMNFEAQLLQ